MLVAIALIEFGGMDAMSAVSFIRERRCTVFVILNLKSYRS